MLCCQALRLFIVPQNRVGGRLQHALQAAVLGHRFNPDRDNKMEMVRLFIEIAARDDKLVIWKGALQKSDRGRPKGSNTLHVPCALSAATKPRGTDRHDTLPQRPGF